jgi:hypothetical protein
MDWRAVTLRVVNVIWTDLDSLAVMRRDFQTPTIKEEIRHYSSQYSAPKQPSSEPHGATRQQAIAKTPAKRSAYQILSLIALFVV